MDIPDTGAVFTLGKSYLSSEDNHSYFFIKNDAVKNIVAGFYQSAVICESGRLFVWGKNDDGQLGIPNNQHLKQQTTITRPSCVTAYKSNGIKIQSIAFGDKFSVTISLDNRVHLCGKQIGTPHSEWTPNEIVEFKTLADDEQLNYTDVQAGNDFFVVLTNCGKAFGYGSNEFNQISKSNDIAMITTNPEQISITEHIKQIVCHDNKSFYVTDTNEIYVFNRTVANRIEFDDDIIEYLNYNRNNNYLYLICESGSYLSELSAKVKADDFRKLNLFDAANDPNPEWNQIQMITFGNDNSLSFTTRSGRFFTNYDRKVRGDEFHEIKKFLNMRIINVSSGAYHILAHALPNLQPLGVINEEIDVRMNVTRSKRSLVPKPEVAKVKITDHHHKLNEMSEASEGNENQVDENMNKMEETENRKNDTATDEVKSAPEKQDTELEKTTETISEKHKENDDKTVAVIDEPNQIGDNLDETKVITDEHKMVINDSHKSEEKIKPETKNDQTLVKVAIGTAATSLAVGTVAAPLLSTKDQKSEHAGQIESVPKTEIDIKINSESEMDTSVEVRTTASPINNNEHIKAEHEEKMINVSSKPQINEIVSNENETDENHNHIPNQGDNHLDVPAKHSNEDHNSISETDSVSDLSFPGSECTVKFRDNPETINSADTNPGTTELDNQISEQDMRSINNAVNLVRVKTFAESKLTESSTPAVVETSAMKIIDTKKNEIYNVIQTSDGQLKQIELVLHRHSPPDEDENQSANESNDIRFIDNGIDVTDDIKKSEEKKVSARLLRLKNTKVAPADSIPPHHMEDEFLGEKMSIYQMKEVRDSKFETQQKLREQFDSPGSGVQPAKQRKPKTPMPIKSRHFGDPDNNSDEDDVDEDDADCRTTASAASTKDPKSSSKKLSISNTSLSMLPFVNKQPPDSRNDDVHQMESADNDDNKVKKFFRNIKDSSCKQIDNIRSDCTNSGCDCMNPPHDENRETTADAANQLQQNTQKKSKICNIL